MKLSFYVPVVLFAFTAPVFAGDADKGESEFRKCKACHSIVATDGKVIVRGGKTGPNLYGVVGRKVASEEFNYGDSLLAIGAKGVVWDEDKLTSYIADPKAWLVEQTGDAAAKTKMSFKLSKGGDDIAAYLAAAAE